MEKESVLEVFRRLGVPIAKRQGRGFRDAKLAYLDAIMSSIDADEDPKIILGAGLFDERLVEYPLFCKWLNKLGSIDHLLDMGMTTNNLAVKDCVEKHVGSLVFINPSADEQIVAEVPSQVCSIDFRERLSVENSKRVDALVSISTIEHVGFSNLQYGSTQKPEYNWPTGRTLIQLANFIDGNLGKRGNFFVTFPIGKAQLNLHPVTLRFASQTFSRPTTEGFIQRLEELGFEVELSWWSKKGEDFVKNRDSAWSTRYGRHAVAANAVATVTGHRA